jgi:hypothetical protein
LAKTASTFIFGTQHVPKKFESGLKEKCHWLDSHLLTNSTDDLFSPQFPEWNLPMHYMGMSTTGRWGEMVKVPDVLKEYKTYLGLAMFKFFILSNSGNKFF